MKLHCNSLKIVLLVSGSCFVVVDSMAQNDDLEKVLACDKIEDAQERLKCFDTVVEMLKAKPSIDSGQSAVVDNAKQPDIESEPELSPEQQFGGIPETKTRRERIEQNKREKEIERKQREKAERLAAETGEQVKSADKPAATKPKDLKEITSDIRRYWKNNRGDIFVVLENDQIWQTTGGSRLTVPDKPKTATIKKGLIGGYSMSIQGHQRRGMSGKVKRIK